MTGTIKGGHHVPFSRTRDAARLRSRDISEPQPRNARKVRPVTREQTEFVFDRRCRDQGIRQPNPGLSANAPGSLSYRAIHRKLAERGEKNGDKLGSRIAGEQLRPCHN